MHRGLPCPMIGMTCKDGGGAKQLLCQHGTGEQVRPCGLAEGNEQVCLVAFGCRVPVSRADHEPAFAHAVVTPAFKNGCEFLGAEVLATFVQ